jgi:hypothetical protein
MAHGLGGDAPLPAFATNPAGRGWTKRGFAQFGLSYDAAASKVAFVNLIPNWPIRRPMVCSLQL